MSMPLLRSALWLLLPATLLAAPACATAQSFPDRPIRFMVPTAPGGGLDTTARAIATRLGTALGQQVVVDNRASAAGNLAADITAKSSPDGHTLLIGNVGNLAVNVHIYKGLGYHPLRDLAPVTMAASGSNVLVVHSSVAAKSVQELIALGKAQPGKLNFGSSGGMSYLAGLLFNQMTGVAMVHVPYKGGAPALTDLIAGQIELMFAQAVTAVPQAKAGKIRALAVTTRKRSPLLPEMPTVAEAGLPGYEADLWQGIAVRTGTPRPIVQRLNTEVARILNLPEVREALFRQGLDVATGTPEAFGAWMKAEHDKWGKIIRDAGSPGN